MFRHTSIMLGLMDRLEGLSAYNLFYVGCWEGLWAAMGGCGLYNTSMVLAVRFSRNFLVCQDQSSLSQSKLKAWG